MEKILFQSGIKFPIAHMEEEQRLDNIEVT